MIMFINSIYFFFFQAEDGIRDGHVTGVQTCALPICNDQLEFACGLFYSSRSWLRRHSSSQNRHWRKLTPGRYWRSEERRVGKECISRWTKKNKKKKKKMNRKMHTTLR